MQYTPATKLSGGEKRRLGLMLVLLQNPNFLILDEPTNDLDLLTLNKLEEFLMNFGGCLILVSHDRFFMDKLVEHYFVIEGDGEVNSHHGTYEEYRALKEVEENNPKNTSERESTSSNKRKSSGSTRSKKLSHNERREYRKLQKEIADLEEQKKTLEAKMNDDTLGHEKLQEVSTQYSNIDDLLDAKTARWFELAEKVDEN